jgi:hypothetical protein
MRRFLIAAIAALACQALSSVRAQEPEGGEGGRQVWFAATAIPADLENPIRVMIGEDVLEVELSSRMTSESVAIKPDGIVRVVRPVPDPANAGETILRDIARATVPEGVAKALIILIPRAEPTPAGILFHTIVQDLAKFGGGDYMFMNLTKLPVAVQLGEKKIALRPGQTEITRAGALDDAVQTPISYHFQNAENGEWQLISASTVVLMPTRREICVFSWDEQYDRINYRGITFPVAD